MTTLRRSPRLAQKQAGTTPINFRFEELKVKSKPLKSKKDMPKQAQVQKVLIDIARYEFIEKVSLRDLYPLIKKHARNEEDRKLKYKIVKTIMANLKNIGIRSKLVDLYSNTTKVIRFLSLEIETMSLCDIHKNIEEIYDYNEISHLAVSHITTKDNEREVIDLTQPSVDDLISSFNNCNVSSSSWDSTNNLDDIMNKMLQISI